MLITSPVLIPTTESIVIVLTPVVTGAVTTLVLVTSPIKGIKNAVAGKTDILLVPNVEAGNGLVKMMIFFMGACAAGVVVGGKVPVVITSRADDTQARLASMAAAVVAL